MNRHLVGAFLLGDSMKRIKPWAFQIRAVDAACRGVVEGRQVLVVSPPGSGKTVMIAETVKRYLHEGKKVVVLSHRKELVDQSYDHFRAVGIKKKNVGVLMAGTAKDRVNNRAPVQTGSIQTVLRRGLKPLADLVIVDEAHHTLADGYQDLLHMYPNAHHVGFTATPFRLDGRGLGDCYDEMVVAATPSELITNNHLAKPILYRAPEEFMPALEDLKVAMGDYSPSELKGRVSRKEIVGNVVDNYLLRAKGRTAIAFAVGIEHSQSMVQAFNKAKVPAEHLDGHMPKAIREAILSRIRSGKTTVVSCCMLLSEGYDLPSCQAVILARPTKSLCLYLQQAGRGLRYYKGHRPVILDHGRNLEKFGLPEADREYVLTSSRMHLTSSMGQVKECPECGVVVGVGTYACPDCGHTYIDPPTIPPEIPSLLVSYTEKEREDLYLRLKTHAAKEGWKDKWVDQLMDVWVGYREGNA